MLSKYYSTILIGFSEPEPHTTATMIMYRVDLSSIFSVSKNHSQSFTYRFDVCIIESELGFIFLFLCHTVPYYRVMLGVG